MVKSNNVTGGIFLLLGVLCIAFPMASSVGIEIFVGVGFLLGALFSLFRIAYAATFAARLYWLMLVLLYGFGGAFMLAHPIQGTFVLALSLGVIFLVEGVMTLIYWSDRKDMLARPWLVLVNGFITLFLGALVIANAGSGIWFIGTLAGIDLFFTGLALFAGRNVKLSDTV